MPRDARNSGTNTRSESGEETSNSGDILEISQGENGELQLFSFLRNFYAVEEAFLRPNWATTRDLLYKIEAEKRRKFMEGGRVYAQAHGMVTSTGTAKPRLVKENPEDQSKQG